MKKRNPNAGLTLLEVMIVLAVIALIAGLAAPRLLANFGRAQSRTAEIQLTNIKGAVQMFYIDTGRYPTLMPSSPRRRDCRAGGGPMSMTGRTSPTPGGAFTSITRRGNRSPLT